MFISLNISQHNVIYETVLSPRGNLLVNQHIYSGNPLDRGDAERRDEQFLVHASEHSSSRFLLFKNQEILITRSSKPDVTWLSRKDLEGMRISEPVFLGILESVYYFAVDNIDEECSLTGFENSEFIDLRSLTDIVDHSEASMAAQGKAQLDWHKRNGFCGVCGANTVMKRGGQVRQCSRCSSFNYARTDSVVIMIIYSGDWCLLGQTRGRSTDKTRYSVLAGFVEQGESIEEAVAREVMEEAGVSVKNVRYHSSQPWPFPSNLMIGCYGEASSTNIKMDNEEMQDIRWFHRDEIARSLQGLNDSLTLPGPIAIAHHLIKSWVEGTLHQIDES